MRGAPGQSLCCRRVCRRSPDGCGVTCAWAAMSRWWIASSSATLTDTCATGITYERPFDMLNCCAMAVYHEPSQARRNCCPLRDGKKGHCSQPTEA